MNPDEVDTMPSIPASVGTSPVRSSCARCNEHANVVQTIKDEHDRKVTRLMGSATFANQGPELTRHSCVFCGCHMYGFDAAIASAAGDTREILVACNKIERLVDHTTGFWFWKKTKVIVADPGCPGIPHLHRRCRVCRAAWVERTSFQERG